MNREKKKKKKDGKIKGIKEEGTLLIFFPTQILRRSK